MPYRNKEDKLKHNRKYFRFWYESNGKKRNRNENYIQVIIEWQKSNPEKVKVAQMLRFAVLKGKVIKPTHCQGCNRETKVVGDHLDYSKPFEVIWLCNSCHKLRHLNLST